MEVDSEPSEAEYSQTELCDELCRLAGSITGAIPLIESLIKVLGANPSQSALREAEDALAACIQPRVSRPPVNEGTLNAILDDCLDRIWDFCPLPEVMAFSQTSHRFRKDALNYLGRRFNNMLAEYVKSPLEMRRIMRENHGVVSGSSALAFILGADRTWNSADLDLYVPAAEKGAKVVRYLCEDGYEIDKILQRLPNIHPYGNQQINTVTKLKKTVEREGREPTQLTVDVIESQTANPILPILRFHTTFVMNWISADEITVTYPDITFRHVGVFGLCVAKPVSRSHGPSTWAEKYIGRGFKIYEDGGQIPGGCGSACPAWWRSTNDVACMRATFGDLPPRVPPEWMDSERSWALEAPPNHPAWIPDASWCLDRSNRATGNSSCTRTSCPRSNTIDRRLDKAYIGRFTAHITYQHPAMQQVIQVADAMAVDGADLQNFQGPIMDLDEPEVQEENIEPELDELSALAGTIPDTIPLIRAVVSLLKSHPTRHNVTTAIAMLEARATPAGGERDFALQRMMQTVLEDCIDRILDFCPLPDVVAFSQTSWHSRTIVKKYLQRRVNNIFKEYVKTPLKMREVMRRHNCVISGSSALAFLLGADRKWSSQDLDMYAPSGRDCRKLIQYLQGEGFETNAVRTIPNHNYGDNHINGVTKLVKRGVRDNGQNYELWIDVIESKSHNPLLPILLFHSTVVINWISADSVTVAYPALTFRHKGVCGISTNVNALPWANWARKYRERGFEIVRDTRELEGPCGSACPGLWRGTNDVGCMEVVFAEGTASHPPDASWSLSRASRDPQKPACPSCDCPRNPFYDGRKLPKRRWGSYTDHLVWEGSPQVIEN
ncbi:hypothetical protein FRB99_003512 [Tulasnella sp. 403]|nr:hypothetical protein FRB99_003512 [Tulasnella sp. 403]